MANLVAVNASTYVSGQIAPESLSQIAADYGIRRVVSNRPDHEDAGQPTAEEIGLAAKAAGMDFLSAPMWGMPSPETVQAVTTFIAQDGATLLFCRSGMRSAVIWAMAEASNGTDPARLRQAAFNAGYDISSLPL